MGLMDFLLALAVIVVPLMLAGLLVYRMWGKK
jgi:hypothetical protein